MKVEYSLKDYVISVRNLIEALDRPAEDLDVVDVDVIAKCTYMVNYIYRNATYEQRMHVLIRDALGKKYRSVTELIGAGASYVEDYNMYYMYCEYRGGPPETLDSYRYIGKFERGWCYDPENNLLKEDFQRKADIALGKLYMEYEPHWHEFVEVDALVIKKINYDRMKRYFDYETYGRDLRLDYLTLIEDRGNGVVHVFEGE